MYPPPQGAKSNQRDVMLNCLENQMARAKVRLDVNNNAEGLVVTVRENAAHRKTDLCLMTLFTSMVIFD